MVRPLPGECPRVSGVTAAEGAAAARNRLLPRAARHQMMQRRRDGCRSERRGRDRRFASQPRGRTSGPAWHLSLFGHFLIISRPSSSSQQHLPTAIIPLCPRRSVVNAAVAVVIA